MKDKNQNQPEEAPGKSIEIAKEKLTELDEDKLEELSGGTDQEQTTLSACSCQTLCMTR